MKKLLITILLLINTIVVAGEYESPLSFYKPSYFIFGNQENQIKHQLSFKYNLIYPFNTGLYFGYTQTSLWKMYDRSAPFVDTNYNPEFFYEFINGNNIFNNIDFEYISFKLGFFEHKSNGRYKPESKSLNRSYIQLNLTTGLNLIELGGNCKIWYYYTSDKELYQYSGIGEGSLFIQLHNKGNYLDEEIIYIRGGIGGSYLGKQDRDKIKFGYSGKNWIESGISIRLISIRIQPYFFINYFHGYNEFMLNYTEKTENAIRFGVLFK